MEVWLVAVCEPSTPAATSSWNTIQAPVQEALLSHACVSITYMLFPTDAGDN